MAELAERVHAESVVIDAACPGSYWRAHLEDWVAGGATACALTVGLTSGARDALYDLADAYRIVRETPGLRLATSVAEIRAAKEAGVLAVILHFQGTDPIEEEPALLEGWWRLGVRVVQLAYNRRNRFCDGCEVGDDAGLSALGRRLVSELNRLGMLVDVSHTGTRSALDAVEASSAPVVASHSNAFGIHPHRRNLPDELIRAIAERGGRIGVNGFPAFVGPGDPPTLDQLIDHIAYVDDLVGPGHVGLGLDYYEMTRAQYDEVVAAGIWSPANYPPPPYEYPAGIENPSGLPVLTARLLERGFDEEAVRGILGENWLRVYEAVWSG